MVDTNVLDVSLWRMSYGARKMHILRKLPDCVSPKCFSPVEVRSLFSDVFR